MSQVLASVCSIVLLAVASAAYCKGLIAFARRGPAWEAAITVLFPLCILPFVDAREMLTDRLVVLETSFNLFALVLALGHRFNRPSLLRASRYLFMVFFAAQVLGFVFAQLSKERYVMLIPSVCMGVGIFRAFRLGGVPKVDRDGRALVFGFTTPVELRWMYIFWVLGVIFVEYQELLPKVLVATLHLSSVVVAFRSGEFFHARILTASHLFIWNFKLQYVRDPAFLGRDFASLPAAFPSQILVTAISWVAVLGCLVALLRSLSRGSTQAQVTQ